MPAAPTAKKLIEELESSEELERHLCERIVLRVEAELGVAIVDLTSACNLACVMCDRPQATRSAPQGDLEAALQGALPYRSELSLGCRHEALVHKDLPGVIARLHAARQGLDHEVHLGLLTSGTLLTEELGAALCSSGLDLLLFSIESAEPASYGRIRAPATWSDLVPRLRTFLAQAAAAGVEVAVQSLFMRSSLPHLGASLRTLAGFGIRRFGISQIARAISREGDREALTLAGPEGGSLRAAVDEVRAVAEELNLELFIPRSPPGPEVPLLPIFAEGKLWDEEAVARARRSVCVAPWFKVRIDAEGYVYPCQLKTDPVEAWGNLLEASLPDIVNGDKAQRHRTLFLEGKAPDASCATCPFHGGNAQPQT